MGIGIIVFIVVMLFIYFIPSIVAAENKRKNKSAIIVLNIFLGWTFIFWVVALVWALVED